MSKCEETKKFKKLFAKKLYVKYLHAKNIKTKNITVEEQGTITNLNSNTASITNLNVTSINGVDVDCDLNFDLNFNVSDVITPVTYSNGTPDKPDNTNNVDPKIFDDLWDGTKVVRSVVEAFATSGRSRSNILNDFYKCIICPPYNCTTSSEGYAIFEGTINNNILKISLLEEGSI